MLYRRPDIARHVRKLVIRPDCPFGRRTSNVLENIDITDAVRRVAAAMRLDALTSFVWDDDEIPRNDDMWFALRMW